jgi:hypothetical protein
MEVLKNPRIEASASILSMSILNNRAFIESLSACVEVYAIVSTGFGGSNHLLKELSS